MKARWRWGRVDDDEYIFLYSDNKQPSGLGGGRAPVVAIDLYLVISQSPDRPG